VGLPLLLWYFPPSASLTAFLLLVAGCMPPPLLPPEPRARPGLFIYSSRKDSLPHLFGVRCAPPCLPCVFIVLIAYYSVSLFSPGGGQSVQGAMLIWPRVVCGNTMYFLAHLVLSSQTVWAWATGTPGALLVSPFDVKWRFSAQAGDVKGSKFCLFSVALPARCVSSVSPRFHCRRHTFCFLPLATILESSQGIFQRILIDS
jgi:hypothetical protein